MEVDQVTAALEGEAGRSSGEVNTGWNPDWTLPFKKAQFQPPCRASV